MKFNPTWVSLTPALVFWLGSAVAIAQPTPETTDTLPVTPLAIDIAAPADAETRAPRSDRRTIEEIVVTAQKKSESINDVPIAINAFNGDSLKSLGVTDTRDLGNLVPGLTYSDSGYATPIYTLRGIGFNDATYNATSTVGVYVDEVNLPYSVMTKGANLDLERVEVLKGPQGTLYGRNTTGGLINYIAKKPTESFEAGLSSGYGSFNTTQVEGYISGPLLASLKGRIAVRDVHAFTGFQHSNTRPDDHLGKQDKQSLRGGLDWAASETIAVRFVLDGWRDASEPQAPQAIARVPQNASVGAAAFSPQVRNYPLVPRDTNDNRVADWAPDTEWQLHERFLQASAHLDWDVSENNRLTAIASHGDVKDKNSLLPQSGYSFYNAEQVLNAAIKTSAVELRLAGVGIENLDWMLGGNVSRDNGNELHKLFVDTNSAVYPALGTNAIGTRISTYGQHKADQLASFVNLGWKFAEPFKLDLGARYTRDERRFIGCSFEPLDSQGVGITNLFNGIAASRGRNIVLDPIKKGDCVTLDAQGGNDVVRGKLSESNLSGRAALNWKPDDESLYYVSASRGFKSGGFPVLSASNQAQYVPVKQEQLLAFEVGSKNTLLEGLAQLNLAGFYYDYKNKQLLTRLLDQVFGPLPVLKNAPKSWVIGVEGDVKVSPIDGLTLSAAGSYIKTKIIQFTSTGFDGNPTDFAGRPFNFSPELQGTLLADYLFPISKRYNLGVGGDYRYTGTTNSTLDENPLFKHDAYGVFNLRARFEAAGGRWTVGAFVQNVTDELTTVSIIQAGDAAARFTGRPRVFGVTAGMNWK